MDDYQRSEWHAFRDEVIRLHGGQCATCGRTAEDGVVLQVHHKRYLPGRKPWAYHYDDCEALCRGCHGREHGVVRPSHGWTCLGFTDLEDLSGSCELCGTPIRYVFLVTHEKWPALEVGEDCCDNLTCSTVASTHMESKRRFVSRLKRFVLSSRWSRTPRGEHIRQRRIELEVSEDGGVFRLWMNGEKGKLTFPTALAAKAKAFELIESGAVGPFLQKVAARRRQRRWR